MHKSPRGKDTRVTSVNRISSILKSSKKTKVFYGQPKIRCLGGHNRSSVGTMASLQGKQVHSDANINLAAAEERALRRLARHEEKKVR